ncbi:MAG: DMT family transporter [Clostridia bacterium]|nr:DMT family transporter [Clostridia bacterium]
MIKDNKKLIGHICALFTVFVWGITFVSSKVLLEHDLTPTEILFYRFIMGYAALWVFYPHKVRFESVRYEIYAAAAGLSGLCLYQFFENSALLYSQASNVSILVSTVPFFTAIAARIVFGRKLTKQFFIGFVIAIIGVVLINYNASAVLKLNPLGDVFALSAAVIWGVYTIFTAILNNTDKSVIGITRRIFFYGIIFVIILSFFTDFSFTSVIHLKEPSVILNLIFLGIAASAICFVTWNTALKYLGSVNASTYIYLIPVVTLIFSLLFLHEKIGVLGIPGALVVIIGLIISEHNKK